VTTARQIFTNRRNARASTGPKTKDGKASVAGNARRHGLNIPIQFDPALSEDAENLARLVAGANAGAELLQHARRFAEAQIDLVRVRRARQVFLNDAVDDANCRPNQLIETIQARIDAGSEPGTALRFADVVADLSDRLTAFERYERRARSRRKFALRDVDAARRRQTGRR